MGFNNRNEFTSRIPPAPNYIGPNQREAAAKRELQEAQAQREEEARQAKAAASALFNPILRRDATINTLPGSASNAEMNDFLKHGGNARNSTVYLDDQDAVTKAANQWLRAATKHAYRRYENNDEGGN